MFTFNAAFTAPLENADSSSIVMIDQSRIMAASKKAMQ